MAAPAQSSCTSEQLSFVRRPLQSTAHFFQAQEDDLLQGCVCIPRWPVPCPNLSNKALHDMMATYPSVVCFSQQSCKTSVQTNFYSIVPMTSYAKLISLQPSAAKETSYVEMGSERRSVACAAGLSGANQRQGWSLQRIASGSTLLQQPGSRTPTTVLIVI